MLIHNTNKIMSHNAERKQQEQIVVDTSNSNPCSLQISPSYDTTQLWEEIDIPIVIMDYSFQIQNVNSAFLQLFNIKRIQFEEIRNQPIFEFSQLPEPDKLKLLCTRVKQLNKTEQIEVENDDFSLRLKLSNQGQSFFLHLYDISIQNQYEELITYKHQMEAVAQLSASVAHELRNPLAVISGFLQLAKLTNKFEDYYQTITSELTRMNGIIDDFLSVSRRKAKKEVVSPVQLMNSIIDIIKPECILHDVTFTYHFEETNGKVQVNEAMIKQVILNLVRNSIEAYEENQDNKTFIIKMFNKGEEYVIKINDNGLGMPEQVLEQLGKPFFTTKEKGTGVGIPLCKKIVEDHGGSFTVSSQLNRGTEVTITIPFA
ncbi:two-component system sensor histidine kinase NtrB [Bacillus alkalicellulosilyticus]|uniref:two-component system sensor histidine kinase NtrB n=1 Tax=Alkalihalobacterium alkalicellulosilyticum TaxID=1912214 RepID=UPI0009961A24|nr:HAMP domain-containing sensor histidine kinase [Bacillus alkalicellulosilyticus]